jgi:hypothetical protein
LLVESLRMFMSPVSNGFEPDDEIAAAVDEGLRALQSGTAMVPDATLDLFLHNKFKNPMLGFIGGHLLLRAARTEHAESPRRLERREVMREVLHNLRWLAPFAPDTVALEVLAHDELRLDPPEVAAVALPPMLRAGYAAVIAAASRNPALVPDGSLSDEISARLLNDSPWTSWEPRTAKSSGMTTSSTPWGGKTPKLPRSANDTYTLGPGSSSGGLPELFGVIAGLGGVVLDTLRELPATLPRPWRKRLPEIGWLERAVIDEVVRAVRSGKLEQGTLDTGEIARRLGVSPHAVRRAIDGLSRFSLDAVLDKAEVDPALRTTIRQSWTRMSDRVSS